MKLLLDMNLSPRWIQTLEEQGWVATHWSTVGDSRADDRVIMQWARENGYVVVTHDLDFGSLLAASSAQKPSVIQVRTRGIMPETLAPVLVDALRRYEPALEEGALVVVEPAQERVRILPLS